MNRRQSATNVPLAVICVGLVLLVVVGFVIGWYHMDRTENVAVSPATNYETHELESIESYRSQYVGNNSNTVNLINALPLADRVQRIEILGQDVVITLGPDLNTDDDETVAPNVLYSAIAIMASIDNVRSVMYGTPSSSYVVSRDDVEARFGAPLSGLLENEEKWQGMRNVIPMEVSSLVK
ncbi:DUF4825 domain-containing protein [Trueperella sp. LYQ141]|uniref:DUF4825 domain-containing protein n=1 Tax=Trueperella sp. LYQ141 TaxID=3391058 RepID=UPI003983B93E